MFIDKIYRNDIQRKIMKLKQINNKKLTLGIIILITISGSIFFFPINIGGKYTCFYHRIFDHTNPVSDINEMDHHHKVNTNLSKSENYDLHNQVSGNSINNTPHHGSLLLDNYLHQYAFLWWTSIGLLALCIYLVLKIKQNINVNESNLTLKR
jgi:hypothetical protein